MFQAAALREYWYLVRAHEWWQYKFPVALGVVYSLAFAHHITAGELILPTILVLIAGSALAIFASVFNDFIDMEQDRLAGKSTPLMGLSPLKRRLVLALSIMFNFSVALILCKLTGAFLVFLSIWAIYTAYSLPPIRLKERDAFGVLAIAVGEHLLASLLAISILTELVDVQLSYLWLGAVIVWSLCFGCRGIIWHQLTDLENDLKSKCTTLGVKLGHRTLKNLAERIIFPIELTSFLLILFSNYCVVSIVFLFVYGFSEYLRVLKMDINVIIVNPAPDARFLMFEYYQIFFPLSFLFAGLISDPGFSVLIALFLMMFATPIALSVNHWNHLIKWLLLIPLLSRLKVNSPILKSSKDARSKSKVEV